MAATTGSARSTTDDKPDDVRHRILLAAREEFAAHGLAGARVDRIARSGRASKERLYAHFTDKESLFHAVLKLNGVEFFSAVTLDPEDLPGFVGQLFDHAYDHPQHRRMLAWARLDGVELDVPHSETSPSAKVQAIRRGQESGHIDPAWDPQRLLTMLFALAQAWVQSPYPAMHADGPTARAADRAAVVEAARRITAPPAR
ncbi:TetR family transcriptional regulator [Clavibacter zhangzhiyongii]|uniref:TetR family transcriptional regulator n=1 Tax=Clavibacter zhangzhiyongii TaxID=2768071 RepID=UPI0039E1B5D2